MSVPTKRAKRDHEELSQQVPPPPLTAPKPPASEVHDDANGLERRQWTLDDYYATLGIERISSLIRRGLGHSPPPDAMRAWAQEYHRFLMLKVMVGDVEGTELSAPSSELDAIWHQHILDTRSYDRFSQVTGCRLHHVPGGSDSEDASLRKKRRDRTQELMMCMFGAPAASSKEIHSELPFGSLASRPAPPAPTQASRALVPPPPPLLTIPRPNIWTFPGTGFK
eukprot:GILK01007474.1.p1 GENE.GILK01007474.1~~GILK01007474.1.p1  ORF type:complete len:224 (+),score=16.34 GILK01007474.1:21-692(+)